MIILGIDPGIDWGACLLKGEPGKMEIDWTASVGPDRTTRDLLASLEEIMSDVSWIGLLAIEKTWKGDMSFENLAALNRRIGIIEGFIVSQLQTEEDEVFHVPVGRFNTTGRKDRKRKSVKGWKEECMLNGVSLMGRSDDDVKKYVKWKEKRTNLTIDEACSVCIARYGERRLVERSMRSRQQKGDGR